jgi:hypothetical protein
MSMSCWARPIALLMASLVVAGCGDASPDTVGGERLYVPSPENARAALAEVLDAWKATRPVAIGPKNGPPRVGLVDSDQIAQRRLTGYGILGPIDLGIGRGFTVRLELEPVSPEETSEPIVRYVVFGREPVWVFRLEDYERISHWEHKMDPDEDATNTPSPTPTGD